MNKRWLLLLIVFPLMGATPPLPDPTRPPQSLIQPAFINSNQAMVLTATFVSPRDQYAIMNGAIIRKGNKIGPFIVTSINSNGVELIGPANRREVVTVTPVVKTPR